MQQLRDFVRQIPGMGSLYQRAKSSWIYDIYWHIADRRIIEDRAKETEFYRNLLRGFREGDLILDVGANLGYKTDIFLRLNAYVVAVEPDETNREILQQKFLHLRLRRKRLTVVSNAVSSENSVQTMWVDRPGSAKNTLSQKWVETLASDSARFDEKVTFARKTQVNTVTLDQLIEKYGLPFFVKIDVEGHELSVLHGLHQPVPYLSFEVNLPEFRPEGLECIKLLEGLAPKGRFNYTDDCRRGLVAREWLHVEEFLPVFESCDAESIEVFWQSQGLPALSN